MRPIHLNLKNFRSHDDTSIDFAGVRVASISGTNGAGKSSILNGITYALYGAKGLGLHTKSDSVIREGASETTVTLVFDVAGVRHRIVRCRKASGKSTLDVAKLSGHAVDEESRASEVWESLSRGTIEDTQIAIVELVGASVDTYLRTVNVGQGDASRFTKATPAERKATVMEALDLGQYPPLEKSAREECNSLATQEVKLSQRVTDLSDQLDRLDADTVRTNLAAATQRREGLVAQRPVLAASVETARSAVEAARVAAASGDAARQRVVDLEQRVATLLSDQNTAEQQVRARNDEATANRVTAAKHADLVAQQPDLVDLTQLEATVTSTNAALETARENARAATAAVAEEIAAGTAVSGAREERAAITTLLVAAGEQVEKVRREPSSTCPTCDQELAAAARATALERLEAQRAEHETKLEAIEVKVREAEARQRVAMAAAAGATEGIETEKQAVAAFAEAQMALAAARATNDQHHAFTAQIAAASAAAERQAQLDQEHTAALERFNEGAKVYAAALTELEQARANVAGDDSAARIAQLEQQRAAAIRALEEHDQSVEQIGTVITRGESIIVTADNIAAQLQAARTEHAPIAQQTRRLETIVRGFGRNGIPAQVIRHAKPQIEQDANDTLAKVGAPYRIRLDLERDTKAGDTRDTLDVTILADGYERPLELLSGGEQYRVAIALRVAIGKVLANRAGKRLETLTLDEPDALDEAGFAALVDLVRALSQEFGLILTVTHSSGLDAACDTNFLVEKVAGASRVQIAA